MEIDVYDIVSEDDFDLGNSFYICNQGQLVSALCQGTGLEVLFLEN